MGEKELNEYRKHLIVSEQKSQEDYDKTVIALSGGALGISFAFLKDYIGEGSINNVTNLLYAWASWGTSVTIVLISYYTSHLALRKAIAQVDENKIMNERPGKCYSIITAILNALAGILFLVGVIFMIYFCSTNLTNRGKENERNSKGTVQGAATTSKARSAP